MKNFIKLLSAFLGFSICFSSAYAGEIVNLWSVQSGQYVKLVNGYLAAATRDSDLALRIEKIDLGNGRFALRDVKTNTYIRAGVSSSTLLATGSPHIRGWETFEIKNEGRDRHSIKSVQNGKYVRAGIGQSSLLGAVSETARGWQYFRFLPAPDLNSPLQSGAYEEISGVYNVTHVLQNDFLVKLSTELSSRSFVRIGWDGSLRATSGCNTVTANIRQNDNWLTSADDQVLMTRMACVERSVHNVELGMLRAIRDMQEFTRAGNTYILHANGKQLMIMQSNR